jgi:hypothetical protein
VGVDWNPDEAQWEASGVDHGKRVPLGFFKTAEEAARAHDDHAVLNGGSRVNFKVEGEVRQALVEPASQFVGVARERNDSKWRAEIKIDGKMVRLGRFDSDEEAARKYDEAAGPLGKPVNFPGPDQEQAVKRGSSKYRGVYWHVGHKKWRASIGVDGNMKHLGLFPDEEAAARAFDLVAARLGRPVNFPGEQQKKEAGASM